MTQQLSNQHMHALELEQKTRVGNVFCIGCFMSALGYTALKEGIIIPPALVYEIEEFNRRNSIVDMNYCMNCRMLIHHSCPSCLKAHIMKKADELDVDNEVVEFLRSIFDEEAGHGGYYIDEGKLAEV